MNLIQDIFKPAPNPNRLLEKEKGKGRMQFATGRTLS
jgi:hypothetical protein